MLPDQAVLWSPPNEEHELARSLGLVDCDRRTHVALLKAGKAEMERLGVPVVVLHSRCQRVVQALSVLGLVNGPAERSQAYAWLLAKREEGGSD